MVFDLDVFMTSLRDAMAALDAATDMLEHAEDSMSDYERGYTLARLDSAVTTIATLLPGGRFLLDAEDDDQKTG